MLRLVSVFIAAFSLVNGAAVNAQDTSGSLPALPNFQDGQVLTAAQLNTLVTHIVSLTAAQASLESQLAATQTSLTQLQAVETIVTQAQANIAALQTDVGTAQTAADQAQAGVVAAQTAADQAQAGVVAAQADVVAAQAAADAAQAAADSALASAGQAETFTALADTTSAATMTFTADAGAQNDDTWRVQAADSGPFTISSFATGSFVDVLSAANNGDVTVAGDLTVNSDRRLKQDIEPLVDALTTISKLNGKSYHWKPGTGRDTRRHYGLIAQEVEAVIPELVTTSDTTGVKSVNYQGLVPILINAVDELKEQNHQQRDEIAVLKHQIELQQIEKLVEKAETDL